MLKCEKVYYELLMVGDKIDVDDHRYIVDSIIDEWNAPYSIVRAVRENEPTCMEVFDYEYYDVVIEVNDMSGPLSDLIGAATAATGGQFEDDIHLFSCFGRSVSFNRIKMIQSAVKEDYGRNITSEEAISIMANLRLFNDSSATEFTLRRKINFEVKRMLDQYSTAKYACFEDDMFTTVITIIGLNKFVDIISNFTSRA